jgi:uncharacterized protein YndB with AHSA1/START domain
VTGPEVIRVEHYYPQSPAAVWKALTDPALHARWWAAGDVQPIVGHRFELDMGQWGKQPCEVLEVQQNRLLKYRFAAGTLDSTITWELVSQKGQGRGSNSPTKASISILQWAEWRLKA